MIDLLPSTLSSNYQLILSEFPEYCTNDSVENSNFSECNEKQRLFATEFLLSPTLLFRKGTDLLRKDSFRMFPTGVYNHGILGGV